MKRVLVVPWSIAAAYFAINNSFRHLSFAGLRYFDRDVLTDGKLVRNQSAQDAADDRPTTGISAYSQSDEPFPGIGRRKWAMRGMRSRAGLIAYPVGPPSDRPIAKTSRPMISGASPPTR